MHESDRKRQTENNDARRQKEWLAAIAARLDKFVEREWELLDIERSEQLKKLADELRKA